MSPALQAAGWGLLAGGALVLGAAIAWFASIPQRLAFGAGVLIAALAFELMQEAYERGGLEWTAAGFLGGAAAYTLANWALAEYGAKHRKRSQDLQPSESEDHGSGAAITVGALLDGVPESIVIGLSLFKGGAVSLVAVIAVFLSNVPEGLSSAAGMKKAGRSAVYVFGVWTTIAVASGIGAWAGYSLFAGVSEAWAAAVTAIAAGAILAMLADTMIPEACEHTHGATGLITVLGFVAAFILAKAGR